MCEEHGYFRGEVCPVCGMEGRFILNDYEMEHLGKTLAGVLRHFPEKFDLTMDPRGWVDVQQFVNAIKARQRRFRWLRAYHIVALIKTDPKGRYEYRDGYIRATYGHTIDVDLDFPTDNVPEKLYYPATEEEEEFLREGGLRPSDRIFVHLSTTMESAVEAGKVRSPRPVVFEIAAKKASEDGIAIMHAAPTIYITKEIPPQYMREAEIPEELLGQDEEENAEEAAESAGEEETAGTQGAESTEDEKPEENGREKPEE